jgi:ABC-type transport system involved in multi-copper enzyme maturation permease subunit
MTPAVLPWLTRDVFRQARASCLTAALLTVTAVATAVCLTADFTPSGSSSGSLTVLFGNVPVISDVPRDTAVRYLQFLLAGVVADTLGVLLALIWTAGFLPSFLDPRAVSVLLAKPASRGTLFVGKFLGVILFVGVQALLFVAATALALGLRTGVWEGGYWLCVPLLLLHFAVFYSLSALLAVMTRSTAAAIVSALLFWLVCWAMNYGRHALAGLELSEASAELARAADLGYWLLPKPADFGLILYDTLDAEQFVTPWIKFRLVQERGLFHPVLSVLSSLAFAAVLLGVAVYEFVHEDY